MKPPTRARGDYEKVKDDEWLPGIIEDIGYNPEYKSVYQGKEKVGPAVRFKFKLEGYKYPHYSRWMSFSYGEKSNLFKKYLVQLVEGAQPDFDFDLDALKGLAIKTMWSTNGDFQNIEAIRVIGKKVAKDAAPHDDSAEVVGDEPEGEPF